MPIKWSSVQVSEAMDMAEEFVNQAAEPLEQANLPGYLDDHLRRLIDDIERIDYVKAAIQAVRSAIPDGAIEAEQARGKYGSQQILVG